MVVPEGWEAVAIGTIAEVKTGPFGSTLHASDYVRVGTPIVTVEHIGEYSITHQNLPLISDEDKKRLSAYTLQVGDIIFSRVGSVDRNAYITKNEDNWLFSGRLLRIRVEKAYIHSKFLSYYLKFNNTVQRIKDVAVGQTMASLNTKLLNRFIIAYPPLSEQRRIAEVLSDTDTYISSLKKLITKKEAIKQGIMQELLTGKKRLPGFSSEWIEKRLGDVIESYDHLRIPVTENLRKKGQYPYYGANGIQDYVSGYTHDGEFVLIAEDGANNLLKYPIFYINARVWVNNHTHIIKGIEKIVTTKFLSYVLKTIHFHRFLVGGTRHKLNGSVMYEIIIIIPPTLAEQTAIANIFSDMDQEIEALKKKLKKVEFIKQGMMQKLLTGEIRLLETTENTKEDHHYKLKNQDENLYAAEKVYSYKTTGRHSKGFDDAVMIAGIVNALYSPQYPLGRKKLQKCLYLLRRYQEQSTEEFKKKAAGPYADEVRYKGGEPIAIKSKYIISHKGTKGTMFSIGNNIKQALEYINRWNMQADIEWVKKTLKFEKVDKLELWATVDMAICDLKSSKIPISVASIKNLIATNKEWSKKLEKLMFSDKNIADAITILQTLFIKG